MPRSKESDSNTEVWTEQLTRVFGVLSRWSHFESGYVDSVLEKVRCVFKSNNDESVELGYTSATLLGLLKAANQIRAAHSVWRLVLGSFERALASDEDDIADSLRVCRTGLGLLNEMSRPVIAPSMRPQMYGAPEKRAADTHQKSLAVMTERQMVVALSMFSSTEHVLYDDEDDREEDKESPSRNGLSVISHILCNHHKLLLNDDGDENNVFIDEDALIRKRSMLRDRSTSSSSSLLSRSSSLEETKLSLRTGVVSMACLLLWNVTKDNTRVQRACVKFPSLLSQCLMLIRDPYLQRSVDEFYGRKDKRNGTIAMVYHALGALISMQSSMISIEIRECFVINGGMDSLCAFLRHPQSVFRQLCLYFLRVVASSHSAMHWFFVKCLTVDDTPTDGVALLCNDLSRFANDLGIEKLVRKAPSFRFASAALNTLLSFVSSGLERNIDSQLSFDQSCDGKAIFLRLFELLYDCERFTREFSYSYSSSSDTSTSMMNMNDINDEKDDPPSHPRWPALKKDLIEQSARKTDVLDRVNCLYRFMMDVLSQFEMSNEFLSERCAYLISHSKMAEIRASKEKLMNSNTLNNSNNNNVLTHSLSNTNSSDNVTVAGLSGKPGSISDNEIILRTRWKRQRKVQKTVLRTFVHSQIFLNDVLLSQLLESPVSLVGKHHHFNRQLWIENKNEIERLHICIQCLSSLISSNEFAEYLDNTVLSPKVDDHSLKMEGILFLFELVTEPKLDALYDSRTIQSKIIVQRSLISLMMRSKVICRYISQHLESIRRFAVMLVTVLMTDVECVLDYLNDLLSKVDDKDDVDQSMVIIDEDVKMEDESSDTSSSNWMPSTVTMTFRNKMSKKKKTAAKKSNNNTKNQSKNNNNNNNSAKSNHGKANKNDAMMNKEYSKMMYLKLSSLSMMAVLCEQHSDVQNVLLEDVPNVNYDPHFKQDSEMDANNLGSHQTSKEETKMSDEKNNVSNVDRRKKNKKRKRVDMEGEDDGDDQHDLTLKLSKMDVISEQSINLVSWIPRMMREYESHKHESIIARLGSLMHILCFKPDKNQSVIDLLCSDPLLLKKMADTASSSVLTSKLKKKKHV